MELVENILAEHPFFLGLNAHYFYLLYDLATHQHFEQHHQIFECGTPADRFFLIHKGKVALQTPFIVNHGNITIQTLEAHEALGWSWLFPPYEWHFGAKALEPTDTVVFNAEALRNYARENHHFGYDLAMRVGGILLQRLQATRLQLIENRK